MFAIGMPPAMLFLEPQNTIAISSSVEKPSRPAGERRQAKNGGEDDDVQQQDQAERLPAYLGPHARHHPGAERRIHHQQDGAAIDKGGDDLVPQQRQAPITGRTSWPKAKGSSSCSAISPSALMLNPAPCALSITATSAASAPSRPGWTPKRCRGRRTRCRARWSEGDGRPALSRAARRRTSAPSTIPASARGAAPS